MEEEDCFIFVSNDVHEIKDRPSKRRKVMPADDTESYFVKLSQGREASKHRDIRFETYKTLWESHEAILNNVIQEANDRTAADIAAFVVQLNSTDHHGKLATGLLVGDHDHHSCDQLFSSVENQIRSHLRASGASLSSAEASNLKVALKKVIQQVTLIKPKEEEQLTNGAQSREHLLSYDLTAVADHVRHHRIDQVLIFFEDSEAFSDTVLSELISMFHAWQDRIPFVLLFGISTSLDLFEGRLSQSTMRRMRCTSFEMTNVDVEDLFQAYIRNSSKAEVALWPGADLISMLLQNSRMSNASNSSFIQACKYIYMIHFFANPLSVLFASDCRDDRSQLDAVRELPSFQAYIRILLEDQDFTKIRQLLNDDTTMAAFVEDRFRQGQSILTELIVCLEAIWIIQDKTQARREVQLSGLYAMALSGKLLDSLILHDLRLSVRKLSSDKMLDLLSALDGHFRNRDGAMLKEILDDLQKLVGSRKNQAAPLRSKYDIQLKSLRTTVVAQKIELNKEQEALSGNNLDYSNIVKRVDGIVQEYLEQSLLNCSDFPLHEILIYNTKSVHRDAFMPRPRYALERALSSPHDYLDCSCCASNPETLSASQPATAILYQLYLESGMLVNSADLWSAFYAIIGSEEADDEEADQHSALASFSQALAELRYLGMVKQSRKRAEHLAKMLWKGL